MTEKKDQEERFGDDLHKGNLTRSQDPSQEARPRDEALEEVRRIRDENEARAASHGRTVVELTVPAFTTSGNEKETGVEVTTAGGRLYLNSHGEAVLDQDGVIALRHAFDAAFQAVS